MKQQVAVIVPWQCSAELSRASWSCSECQPCKARTIFAAEVAGI